MIGRICVASDMSETATRAVAWAAEVARRFEAELVVVQVGGNHGALDAYVQERAPGARSLTVQGDEPAAAIAEAAHAEKADLLVVGNVGMSGRKEFLLGNVPNRVSHLARCTVVIVNTAEPEQRSRLPWRR